VDARVPDLTGHWVDLPGWPADRPLHACYLTFADEPELHAVAAAYAEPLRRLGGFDLVEPRWTHLSVQGLGFSDTLPPTGLADLVGALRREAAITAPLLLQVGAAEVHGDAVYLPVSPARPLHRLRDRVRAALARSLPGQEWYVLPGQEETFDPHVTVAYPAADQPGAPVAAALAAVAHPRVTLEVTSASMVTLVRADRAYRWTDEIVLPFSGRRRMVRRRGQRI
jgi:2'-5' RNA ligase